MNERTEVGFEMCKACIRISLCLMFVSGLMLGRSTAGHAQSVTYIPFVAGAGESPTIELTISGNVKLNLLVDTGCTECMITDAAVQKLGLKPLPRPIEGAVFRVHGREAEAVMMPPVPTWPTVGGTPFYVVPAAEFNGSQVHVDGFIGMSVLRHHAILFDFENRRLGIWSPGRVDAKALATAKMQTSDTFTLPITPTPQKAFKIKVGLNSSIVDEMYVDTGGGNTEISSETAEHLHTATIGPEGDYPIFGTVLKATGYSIDALAIGPVKLTAVAAYVVKDPPYYHPSDVLGMDVLVNFNLLFDYSASKVYMRRITHARVDTAKYTWSMKYHVGQTYQIRREYSVQARFADGKQHRSIQHDLLTYTVTKLNPDGTVVLSVVKHNEGIDVDADHRPADPNADSSFEQQFAANGNLIKDTRATPSSAFEPELVVMFQDRRVPAKPVAIADTWQSSIPSLTDPGKQVNIEYMLYDSQSTSGTTLLKIHFTSNVSLATTPRSAVYIDGECVVDPATGHTLYRTTRISNAVIRPDASAGSAVKGVIEVTEQLIGKPDDPTGNTEKK